MRDIAVPLGAGTLGRPLEAVAAVPCNQTVLATLVARTIAALQGTTEVSRSLLTRRDLLHRAGILMLGSALSAVNQAQEIEIAHHEVSFVSRGVTLRGTLYVSDKTSGFAAAVWVDGAGKTRRNQALGRILAQNGVALLTYDKRGVGQSGGIYAGTEVGTNNVSRENLALLTSDAAAALRALRREERLRGLPLGFIGGSQAGWIVPSAALQNRDACFMLLWSGAVETTHEDVLFEQVALPDLTFWDHHTHEEAQELMTGKTDNLAWADFDPRDALSKLTIPGLWIFGGRDRNLNVDLAVARLQGLIAAGHSNYAYRVFPDYDHNLGGEQDDVMGPSVGWIRDMVSNRRASRVGLNR